MDNIAHTLAGVALAEAGLRRRTGLATATLAIGANLPDVDVLIYVVGTGVDALAFRRGWTHGILAMLVLPLILAGLMLAWDRFVRQRRRPGAAPVDARWLLILSAIGIWSHPLLDLLNTYGVRLLMPFSGRWFYGDTLFIVDPWLWGALAIGIVLSRMRRRRDHTRPAFPARAAIAGLVVYVAAMAASSRAGRAIVERQTAEVQTSAIMVAPLPVTPLTRAVVRELRGGGEYETGTLTWLGTPRYSPGELVRSRRSSRGIAEAERMPDVRAFLTWSRFPVYTTVPGRDSTVVRITDMRYPGQPWASVEVVVPASAERRFATP